MKVGEFQKEVNITPNAYSRFMSQHGKDKGSESSVYLAAWAFFKTREIQGIKTTPNKKAKSSQGPAEKDSVPSIDDIELDGEKDDKAPVFGELRDFTTRKLYTENLVNRHMRRRP
jgi:hypothetical protein